VDEGGDLFVGGEAERDELAGGELVDVGQLIGWKQGGETKALFKTNDAVLQLEVVDATFEGEDEERDGDEDRPVAEPGIFMPKVNGDPDGGSHIGDENGKDEEMDGGIDAVVVGVALRSGHGFLSDGRHQHSMRGWFGMI